MNAHAKPDDVQAHAEAYRVMDSIDRDVKRTALDIEKGKLIERREGARRTIDQIDEEILALKTRRIGVEAEWHEHQNGVVRVTDELAALEKGVPAP